MTKEEDTAKEPYYVATAIPYVNARIHIGNSIDHLTADVLARYQRKLGKDVIFSVGTDEHGAKIAEKAAEAGIPNQEFVDKHALDFANTMKLMGVSENRIVRTTDKAHKQRVQLIWQKLEPYIYKGEFKGWYCVGCEEYKTDTHVKDTAGICPDHERKYDELKEENYFFKLTEFTGKIKQAIEADELQIVPGFRAQEVLNLIEDGVEDFSISRPATKINWGIEVPGDPSQYIYVWFEALMNYITILGYPEHQDFERFWPADVQVIGKGILRFHAIIWPAVLMGLDIPLYKQLYVHGYVTIEGKKISKTLGNVVEPAEIVDKYGVDAFRYFCLRHFPSYNDGDFSLERFENVYNGELANELGNTVSRVVAMITKYQEGVIGSVRKQIHDPRLYHEDIANFRFDKALDFIWLKIHELNKYIEVEQPWKITDDKEHLSDVLAYAAGNLLEIADLLEPFLPDTSQKIVKVFGRDVVEPLTEPLFARLDIPKQKMPVKETANSTKNKSKSKQTGKKTKKAKPKSKKKKDSDKKVVEPEKPKIVKPSK